MTDRPVGPPRTFVRIIPLAVAVLLVQGCSTDMGPPPDETVKNHPIASPKPSSAAIQRDRAGAPKFKSIKDRS
jgi:hypothetical protein